MSVTLYDECLLAASEYLAPNKFGSGAVAETVKVYPIGMGLDRGSIDNWLAQSARMRFSRGQARLTSRTWA